MNSLVHLILVGAPVSGYLSDRIVIRYREARGGVWYPEDRLRATLSGALFLVPLSMILSGLITEYVRGPIGLCLVFICFFVNGLGVCSTLPSSYSYSFFAWFSWS
jgi:hypothetical protein